MARSGKKFQSDAFQGEGFFPLCPESGAYHRDLTPAFQGLVIEACAAVVPSTQILHQEFPIDDPQTTWRMMPEVGLFTITIPGQGRAHSVYHSVGHWVEESGAFKWSWAEQDPTAETTKAAEYARSVGVHYWMRSLTAPTLFVGETEARQLAMVTAYLSEHPAITAVPTPTGRSFLVLERPVWEN